MSGAGQDEKRFPPNALSSEFLALLREQDETAVAAEAESAGPWKVVPVEEGFGLFRAWEEPEAGFEPQVVCRDRELALRCLAIWPAVGREPLYQVSGKPDARGFALESGGQVVGTLKKLNDNLLFALNLAEHFSRSPLALAALLEAAGPLAQEIVGEILAQHVWRVRETGAV
ncbi:MAG TPA: hypothetical protein VF756_15795 [Thermoanaerobaculia bacterium]